MQNQPVEKKRIGDKRKRNRTEKTKIGCSISKRR